MVCMVLEALGRSLFVAFVFFGCVCLTCLPFPSFLPHLDLFSSRGVSSLLIVGVAASFALGGLGLAWCCCMELGGACITNKERAFTDGTGIPSKHLAMIPLLRVKDGSTLGGSTRWR